MDTEIYTKLMNAQLGLFLYLYLNNVTRGVFFPAFRLLISGGRKANIRKNGSRNKLTLREYSNGQAQLDDHHRLYAISLGASLC